MSHTLHRRGAKECLAEDFIVFSMSAKGINHEGSAARLERFLRIAYSHKPVNMGDMKTGNMAKIDPEEIMSRVQDTSIVHAVFTDPGVVTRVLQDLEQAELGTSVIVSGVFDEVSDCLCRSGLQAHTIEHSLGIKGQTHRLASDEILEITTMCGHGMVSSGLVCRAIRDFKRGRMTAEQAALMLAKPCECGIFNPVRAKRLIEKLAAVMTFDW